MTTPNIVQTAYIHGKTDVQVVGTATAAITTNSVGSGRAYKINLLQAANVNGDNHIDISASLRRSSVDYFIAKVVAVPADGSLVMIGKENPIYLNEGDSIVLQAEAAASIHAICSYEIISETEIN
jgi:hypothetical protein